MHTFLLGGKEAQEEEGKKSGASETCQEIKAVREGRRKGMHLDQEEEIYPEEIPF